MIFADFQNGILNRLKGDAYFTQSEEIELRAEVRPNTRKEVQLALSNRGIIGVVGLPKFERAENDAFLFSTALEFFDNPQVNQSGRTGFMCLSKSLALTHNYVIPISDENGEVVEPFSKLRIVSGGYAGEREGIPVYQLIFTTKIYIDVLVQFLATEAGVPILTSSGSLILISPTDP